MADTEKAECTIQMCPEFQHPGLTGCPLTRIESRIESIESVMIDVQVFFKNRWTRMEKIAAAAIIGPILAALLGWMVLGGYTFVQRVDKAIDQLDEIHKTHVLPQKAYPKMCMKHPHQMKILNYTEQ